MKFLMIAGFADDLLPFRGDLIDALLERGIQVHVALPDLEADCDLRNKLLNKGLVLHKVTMQRAGMNPLADLYTTWQLLQLIKTIRPEAVFAYLIKPVIYGMMASSITDVPHRFALISGLGYAFQGKKNQRGLLRRLVQGLYAISLNGAHKIFFQNPDDLKLFHQLGILKPNAPTCVVNGSGVNVDYYSYTPIPKNIPCFLMIARFLVDKGIREYAAAAKLVKAQYPKVRFTLVGWLDENPSSIAQEELDTWIAEGTIENIGRLSDVRPAIAQCSVYVLPSYREGTPRSVLEAMSMGRAIITTDAPGCRETVRAEDNGLLVPVGSVNELAKAMLRFMENEELVLRMGQRSREIAEEKYDVHKVNQVMLNEMGIF
ncbi:glycosyltransferase family 4 protein [uncultured Nitrosomonas sp.]|uniref:glycosyltransferase family 4 protein n=1 Tax=uncultured Nitrosomonas sp. TaxID=156424 RepID=UPI0025EEE133|nr:glycosyltransferase family 4 protein [uncultured Nitrosomonas sp.]